MAFAAIEQTAHISTTDTDISKLSLLKLEGSVGPSTFSNGPLGLLCLCVGTTDECTKWINDIANLSLQEHLHHKKKQFLDQLLVQGLG